MYVYIDMYVSKYIYICKIYKFEGAHFSSCDTHSVSMWAGSDGLSLTPGRPP